MDSPITSKVDKMVNLIPLDSLTLPVNFGHQQEEDKNSKYKQGKVSVKRHLLGKKLNLAQWLPTTCQLELNSPHSKQIRTASTFLATKNHYSSEKRPNLEITRSVLSSKIESSRIKSKSIPSKEKNISMIGIHTSEAKIYKDKSSPARPEKQVGSGDYLGDMDFGSFMFAKRIRDTGTKLSQQNKKGNKLKSIRKTLKEITRNQKEIGQLKGPGKLQVAHNQAMKKAFRKVEGKKVTDDIKKLKKNEKAIKGRKQRSKKRWNTKQKN